jgi:predicted Zn-dependent protease
MAGHSPRPRLLWLLPVAGLALVVACATNPVTGQRQFSLMSEAQEIGIGRDSYPQIQAEMGFYDDPALQNYVSGIGLEMARSSERPDLPWTFTVVDETAINAFAVPGGYIYITRGILAFLGDEAELAGVLGHEIGHVTARHSAQQYSQQVLGSVGLLGAAIFAPQAAGAILQGGGAALQVLGLRYGRQDEIQADELGARYTAANNWDPSGVQGMLSTLGRIDEARGDTRSVPNWLSTHPDPLARVATVQPVVNELRASGRTFIRDRDEYLGYIDGMVYGDNPDEGITVGSRFLHKPLRFRIDFPSGWDIQNGPTQVVAKAPGADIYMLLMDSEAPENIPLRDAATRSMSNGGFTLLRGTGETINGLDTFVGIYRGSFQGIGEVLMRTAHIRHGDITYMVGGFANEARFNQVQTAIADSFRSFAPLTQAEADAVQPNRVDMYVVRAGDTWGSIAERSGGLIEAPSLAIMNGTDVRTPPQVGQRIRIVVGG